MNLVKIDPPGSWCEYDAAMSMIRATGGRTFLEVGCGAGVLSRRLCEGGWHGLGVDSSEPAIHRARENLREFIDTGQYRLLLSDMFDLELPGQTFDVGISLMVMEHVQDDLGFLERLVRFITPGGHVVVAVPGRRDRWGIEDEMVGHFRRYDRGDLQAVLRAAGLTDVEVWSVAIPVANALFHLGNLLIRMSPEVRKLELPRAERTRTSGLQEIPLKTVFPPVFRLLLNRVTLSPLFVLQRLFYQTDRGLVLLGSGSVRHP